MYDKRKSKVAKLCNGFNRYACYIIIFSYFMVDAF